MRHSISVWCLGLLFILAGLNHFLNPDFYRSLMPPYLPAHLLLIYLSGIAEIAGGVGVLIHGTRRMAGIGLILLLIAVFPANIHAAMNGIRGSSISKQALIARLPLQALLIAWVYFSCVKKPHLSSTGPSGKTKEGKPGPE